MNYIFGNELFSESYLLISKQSEIPRLLLGGYSSIFRIFSKRRELFHGPLWVRPCLVSLHQLCVRSFNPQPDRSD